MERDLTLQLKSLCLDPGDIVDLDSLPESLRQFHEYESPSGRVVISLRARFWVLNDKGEEISLVRDGFTTYVVAYVFRKIDDHLDRLREEVRKEHLETLRSIIGKKQILTDESLESDIPFDRRATEIRIQQ